MVLYSWIKECLEVFGEAANIKTLFVNTMEKSRVMLFAGNSELGEVDIKRGIFKEDSLSPLVFVLPLITLRRNEKINHLLWII